jgi:hypothetical protein
MMRKIPLRHKKNLEERVEDEISKEVREVKREWRHFIKFKDENYLLFTAFVIVIAASLIINTVYILNRNSRVSATKTLFTPDTSRVLTSLQKGTNSGEAVKISNVTENSKTDYAFTIDPNETMLILNISITNNTVATQQLIPVNQFYVRSNEGDYRALHASMYVTTPLAAAELAPGKTATGQLSFNVPKHIAHPLLYVDTGWDNSVPLVYDVLR